MPRTLLDAPEVVPSPSRFPRGCGCLLAVAAVIAVSTLLPWCGTTPVVGHRRDSPIRLKSAFKGLEIALKGFEIEYNKDLLIILGKPSSQDFEVGSDILAGLTADDQTLNPRKVKFYDPPAARNQKDGMWKDETGYLQLRDYWGNLFILRFDANQEGRVGDPEKPGEFVEGRYLFYTAGPDRDPATWKDNITSWRDMPRKFFWGWD